MKKFSTSKQHKSQFLKLSKMTTQNNLSCYFFVVAKFSSCDMIIFNHTFIYYFTVRVKFTARSVSFLDGICIKKGKTNKVWSIFGFCFSFPLSLRLCFFFPLYFLCISSVFPLPYEDQNFHIIFNCAFFVQ